jgi:hypothetical protein
VQATHSRTVRVNSRDAQDRVQVKRAGTGVVAEAQRHTSSKRGAATEAVILGMPARNWPPRLVAPSNGWRRNYPTLADAVGIRLTLDEAIAALNDWILKIDDTTQ